MQVSTLSADAESMQILSFVSHSDSIEIVACTSQDFGVCPLCRTISRSLHSHYDRQIADLPWHGVTVRMLLQSRKFRCRNEICRRQVFCERLPKVVESYGRKTNRLQYFFKVLGFALGGAAGSRTAGRIGLKISGDTLLRQIRSTSLSATGKVKVLGVDDFAFRRGATYGTILVDLEKRQPIDLLPDREAETFQLWLAAHPEVEIISRDRGGAYASGARNGAPQAVQVADRFHLLKNLLDGFEKFLARRHENISQVFQEVFKIPAKDSKKCVSTAPEKPLSQAEILLNQQKAAKLKADEKHFQTVKDLRAGGMPILRIARHLKMSRNTVKKFLAAEALPKRQPHQKFSPIHRFLPFLKKRWEEGERSSRTLWKAIKEKGYQGAEVTLRHFLQKWRTADVQEIEAQASVKSAAPGRAPSARQIKWWLFKEPDDQPVEPWQQLLIEELCRKTPEIETARKLILEFHRLLKERQPEEFKVWLGKARKSGIGELVGFANGVEQDRSAVEQAFESEWSQGQTEGQVNRLKFLKRQMYGRAKFDLLRARVVYQS